MAVARAGGPLLAAAVAHAAAGAPAWGAATPPRAVAESAADSIDVLAEVLSGGAAAGVDAVEVAAQLQEARVPDGRVGRDNQFYLRLEQVAGYRASRRAEAGWLDGTSSLAVSLRQDRDRYGGYIETGGWGPVVTLLAGGIRPRFGEGLILGSRYSPFTPPVRPRGDCGGVLPTQSISGRKVGAAVTLGAGPYAATASIWRDDDRSEVCWTWLSRAVGSGVVALAVGNRRGTVPNRWDAADASVAASRTGTAIAASAEIARWRGRLFAAGRAALKAGGVWTMELFESPAPSGYSGGVAAPGDQARVRRGGALHREGGGRKVYTRVSLYANSRRTPAAVTERRRFDVLLRAATGRAGRWNASVRVLEERESQYSDDAIDYQSTVESRRQVYVRAGWTGGDGGALRQQYRFTARFEGDGAVGTMGMVGLCLSHGGHEAGFQVSNYSMGSGQTGYVVGAGGPEMVSAVTRTGSTVSARIRLSWRGLRFAWFWSQPWRKPPRSYASAAVSL